MEATVNQRELQKFRYTISLVGLLMSAALGEGRYRLHRIEDQLDEVRLTIARIEGHASVKIVYPHTSE